MVEMDFLSTISGKQFSHGHTWRAYEFKLYHQYSCCLDTTEGTDATMAAFPVLISTFQKLSEAIGSTQLLKDNC